MAGGMIMSKRLAKKAAGVVIGRGMAASAAERRRAAIIAIDRSIVLHQLMILTSVHHREPFANPLQDHSLTLLPVTAKLFSTILPPRDSWEIVTQETLHLERPRDPAKSLEAAGRERARGAAEGIIVVAVLEVRVIAVQGGVQVVLMANEGAKMAKITVIPLTIRHLRRQAFTAVASAENVVGAIAVLEITTEDITAGADPSVATKGHIQNMHTNAHPKRTRRRRQRSVLTPTLKMIRLATSVAVQEP